MRAQVEETPRWKQRFEQVIAQVLSSALAHMQIEHDELRRRLEKSGALDAVNRYAFEIFITDYCEEEDGSFIERYLEEKSERCSPDAVAFFQALNTSSMNLWRVEGVQPDSEVSLAAINGTEKIAIRAPAEGLAAGQYLLARVLQVGETARFGQAMFTLSAAAGGEVERKIGEIKEEIITHFAHAGQDEGAEVASSHLQAFAAESVADEVQEFSFNAWADSIRE